MHPKIIILLSAITLLLFNSAAGAGQKSYSFDAFFRESEARLERLGVTRGNGTHGNGPVARSARVAAAKVAAAKVVPRPVVKRDPPRSRQSMISELIGGVWSHDTGEINEESDSWDFNGEIIFHKVRLFEASNRFLKFLAEPRPVIGGSINSQGKTHTVYTGFSWAKQFQNGLFFNFVLGGTYHTGNLEQAARQCAAGEGCALAGNRAYIDAREPTLGSAVLFREGLDLGYRLGAHGVSIFASHISNAGLDNDNDGINFVGMRYSFAFDENFQN
ncbi:MAG: acyloxyacyl hydrolase [Rhodospirillales bacterium]|nr:acyloxyacyl hydrolase [Rhodospirillales bacterium]